MKTRFAKHAHRGTTFVELLLYVAIFLVLTPVLLMVSINAVRTNRMHNVEKQVNSDSQFMVERVYDLVSQAKKVDMALSTFGTPDGKLAMVMQDGASVIVERNPASNAIEITEGGVKSALSSNAMRVDSLYFEKIADQLNDPEIAMGVNVRLAVAPAEENSVPQNYVTSANLEKGDFDNDGSPDYVDRFPRNAECAGDQDADGVCDELDNAVAAYNPFQEDFDADGIGDVVDATPFEATADELATGHGTPPVPGSTTELPAVADTQSDSCSGDDQLLAFLDKRPLPSSSQLKSILIASSPLSPTVLNGMITRYEASPFMNDSHFREVFSANVKLPDDVYTNLMAMTRLSSSKKSQITSDQNHATHNWWLEQGRDHSKTIRYDISRPQNGKIKFTGDRNLLGEYPIQMTDVFTMTVTGGTGPVEVTTTTSANSAVTTLAGVGSKTTDSNGFSVAFDSMNGSMVVLKVSNVSNSHPLLSVAFFFGNDAVINHQSGHERSPEEEDRHDRDWGHDRDYYEHGNGFRTHRYAYYCPGGCATQCGDVGTGVLTGRIFTDKCYQRNNEHPERDDRFPEWCSKWSTSLNDNSRNPAYLGGTQQGEDTLYWEKTFKTTLNPGQLENLKSITVGGEVAYQSTTQFFCDQFQQSCPMNGTLVGAQNVELYNWQTNAWETVAAMALDGTKSDQQQFELLYSNADVLKFVGGNYNKMIKARMPFHWNGVAPQGKASAPAFMLIDYFTLHLKW
ncbi:hypothetical protein HZA44_00860 [Candidatus Peregrinibacteria bacterium]|nr:hypothetical protein [Candidatus Peregrinibacteria bacterium]